MELVQWNECNVNSIPQLLPRPPDALYHPPLPDKETEARETMTFPRLSLCSFWSVNWFSSVQFFLEHESAQSCPLVCNPLMDCSTPGFSVHHQFPEFAQTHVHWVDDAIQPSHPLLSPYLPWITGSKMLACKETPENTCQNSDFCVLPRSIEPEPPEGVWATFLEHRTPASSLLLARCLEGSQIQRSRQAT